MSTTSVEVITQYGLLISTVVQAVATCVLVGVTIFYAYQTKKTVETMDRSSKAEFLPILMLGFRRASSNETKMHFTLKNVGRGLAKRPVKVTIPGATSLFLNSMTLEDEESVGIFTYDIGYILGLPESQRKIVVEYHDIFSRTIKTEAPLVEHPADTEGGLSRCLGWETWYPIIP
jgi:hypothetical protein